ncbi:hypothetical protein HBI07_031290 [Parastagonospora nodorum]|nr:hypothetical protein HBI07_031290 [Parastagonospora nodorum]
MPSSPTPFPPYLLPSLPFRRRSSTSTTSTSPTSSPSSSPPQPSFLTTSTPTSHLHCNKCLTHLLPVTHIISKGFTGRHGRAYLVAPPPPPSSLRDGIGSFLGVGGWGSGWAKGTIPNTHTHKPVSRQLSTGAHTVADISCVQCGTVLGWKYVDAVEEGQKYKVGKFILETGRVVRGVEWEERRYGEEEGVGSEESGEGDEIQFDSQDEDECEDLFSGIWSRELAVGRRRKRRLGR